MDTGDEYNIDVREVRSGDDLIAMVDLGVENLWKRQRIRLYGVDAPNAFRATEDTEAGRVRAMVRDMVAGRKVSARVVSRTPTSWICLVYCTDGDSKVCLNDTLTGMGYKYTRKED